MSYTTWRQRVRDPAGFPWSARNAAARLKHHHTTPARPVRREAHTVKAPRMRSCAKRGSATMATAARLSDRVWKKAEVVLVRYHRSTAYTRAERKLAPIVVHPFLSWSEATCRPSHRVTSCAPYTNTWPEGSQRGRDAGRRRWVYLTGMMNTMYHNSTSRKSAVRAPVRMEGITRIHVMKGPPCPTKLESHLGEIRWIVLRLKQMPDAVSTSTLRAFISGVHAECHAPQSKTSKAQRMNLSRGDVVHERGEDPLPCMLVERRWWSHPACF
mmetsp:Transcript_19058/g.51198  ORF Transcript_19058/g.51198 Transcript_19058/m.51198 type:complete len:270 (-) Transcript_19058:17-826(-)